MPYHAIWPRLSAAWFQVNRQFHDLTRNSPALQHQRDLFSAGFTENRDCDPGDLVQRRKLCEEHERKWSNSRRTAKMVHKLPEELISQWSYTTTLSRNLVISPSSWDNSLILLRIPPVMGRKSIEWWNTPPFADTIMAFAAYPPNNILAVAEGNP